MAVTAKIDLIDRDVIALLSADLAPEAQSAALAGFARSMLAEAQETNRSALGFVPPHDSYVDGRASEQLETVQPAGTIVFEFHLLNDVFAWIGEQLVLHSPVLTGRYARSHIFMADGVEVDPGAALPAASEYLFVSPLPYARKIERGLSEQAPDGVFQAVAALAARRFGNVASITFTYRALHVDGDKSAQRDARRPAILIRT